jgi:MFS family permease
MPTQSLYPLAMTSTAAQKTLIIAAFATVGICDIAFGLTLQLQPLVLDKQGVPAWLIGTIAAAGSIATIATGPFIPQLVKRFGSKACVMAAMAAIVFCLVVMPFVEPLYWWIPLRFLLGMSIASLFAVSEAWVTAATTDANRGRIMGLYTSMLSLTFAAGPMMIPFTGIDGMLPWMMGAFCVALGFIPLAGVKPMESQQEEAGSFWSVCAKAPLLFACVLTATTFDSIYMSFFTIFATRNGVPLGHASWLLGVGIAAGALFFYPMGMIADRWSKHGLVLVSTVITIACALLLQPLINSWLAWPLLMIFTTAAFGVYVVALAMVGDIFKGHDIVSASAGIAAMWGLGGLLGPPIAGRLIDSIGIGIVPYVLASIYTILLALLLMNGGRIVRPKPLLAQTADP